jgi:hypothetical protein
VLDNILGLQNTPIEAGAKRYEVGARLKTISGNIQSDDIEVISGQDLRLLFAAYDQVFFAGALSPAFGGILRFSLSRRMTRSAGSTLIPKKFQQMDPSLRYIEIRISADVLFNYDMLEGYKLVGGVRATTALEALQLVFEHELCHVLEYLIYGKTSCKKADFQGLSARLFGHDTSYHQLPTPHQIAQEKLGIGVGAQVFFEYEGKRHRGVVSNITKRATVMVRDKKGMYRDNKGHRYSKYYIALAALQPA